MIYFVLKEKNFLPDVYLGSIFEIDFKNLHQKGIRLVLIDLDNTLIPYDEALPNEKIFQFKRKLDELGMELIIVSNSRKKRVRPFAKKLEVPYQSFSTKPLKRGIKKAIRKASRKYQKNEITLIGDQIMTDVYVGNRCNLYTILVKAIKRRSEISTTRINRLLEKNVLKHIRKKYPNQYAECLKKYEDENHGKN